MYAIKDQVTPAHYHKLKKEDIIVRQGRLALQLWPGHPKRSTGTSFKIKVNSEWRSYVAGEVLVLAAGERITISPEVVHKFYPVSDACIIGEVSTANDDNNDNFFIDSAVGRFSEVIEDEKPVWKLVSDE